MLADDLACALDPVRFARRAGLEPDPWQVRVLRSPARQIILNCSRQVGKSTVTGILAGHTARYDPGAPILLLSPSERQSIELLRKVRDTLRLLGTVATEVQKDNALSLEFANGSRIIALPGKEGTIRGFSGVRLLVIDEASRVPDALYQAVRPMLAVSGGSCSSPRRSGNGDSSTTNGPRVATTGSGSRSRATSARASIRPGSTPSGRGSASGGSSRNTSANSWRRSIKCLPMTT